MGRHTSSTRASGGAVAVTTLLLALQLLLPAPASSQAALVVRAFPFIKKYGRIAIKEVVTAGGPALIKHALSGSTNDDGGGGHADQLGAAAADNAGVIVYDVSIGSAQQNFSGVVDLFSNFVWVQCPEAPPAFSAVPCASQTCITTLNVTDASNCSGDCDYEYGDADYGTNTTGYLAQETFTVGAARAIAGTVVFGCSSASELPPDGDTGVIGFSKGPFSILSQLGISRFSYFLTPDDSNTSESTSVVLLGDQAVAQTKHSHSTPFQRSSAYPELYYVKLTEIQVDGESLTGIPAGAFDLTADGSSGGVVLSTTYPITYLQEDAYNALRNALLSKITPAEPMNNSGTDDGIFDLCYSMQAVAGLTFPKITLVFAGEDSPALELTTVNYFYKDTETGLQCLTMLPTGAEGPSVLGSMMQAGANMIYDVGGGHLIFEKGTAAAMVPSKVSFLVIAASLLLAWVCLF
uniref:Uncharacterized protein n=1 Tax=Avena sativa TaxID=4498 RepID=A0ACD5ZMW2_AVESA